MNKPDLKRIITLEESFVQGYREQLALLASEYSDPKMSKKDRVDASIVIVDHLLLDLGFREIWDMLLEIRNQKESE